MLFQDGRYFHSSREPEIRVIDNFPNALADTCASGRSVLCKGRLYQTPPSRVYPPQLRSVPVVNGTALDGQGAGEPPVFVFVAVALLKANGEHKQQAVMHCLRSNAKPILVTSSQYRRA